MLRRKTESCLVLTWKKNLFWVKVMIEWITVLNTWNKRYEKFLCVFVSWWKIMLQWPCNEPLNALRATSTTKTNCLHRKLFPPPPSEKKLIRKWRWKDCVTHYTKSYVLRWGIFLLHKKLNSYQEVVHWKVDIATYRLIFHKSDA